MRNLCIKCWYIWRFKKDIFEWYVCKECWFIYTYDWLKEYDINNILIQEWEEYKEMIDFINSKTKNVIHRKYNNVSNKRDNKKQKDTAK